MNKETLIAKIIAHLEGTLTLITRAARTARSEATDEECKAEDKYDTRGLEASYLARGQSRHAAEIEEALEKFQTLRAKTFGPKDPIDVGALVELKSKRDKAVYFVAPSAGGTEIQHEDAEVVVITPQSPLGQQLIGKKKGTSLKIKLGGMQEDFQIASVC